MAFTNYNPDRVVATFAGNILRGFADATFIKVRPLSAGFTSKAGADGDVSHSRTNDPRVEITVSFMMGSSSNDVLSAIHEADLIAPGGAGVSDFLMTDLNGTTVLECANCRIMKAPDMEFGKEDGQYDWVLEGVKTQRTVGGR